jgi:hypothetical protein
MNGCELDPNKCEVMKEQEKFLYYWCTTESNPCPKCSKDKSKCSYYKKLVERGILD